MEDYEFERLEKLLVDGLRTDGGHHKQWYLEQILLFLVGYHKFDRLREKHDWEKGIAP